MEKFDTVICGGGAAGLTAGLYAARGGKRCVIFDRGESQMTYAAKIANMPGFLSASDGGDGFTLWSAMRKQAVTAGADYRAEEILSVDLAAKTVTTAKATYTGDRIVLCLGRRASGLGLPGEAALVGRGVSFCALCDGGLYRGKSVVVIGGGNTAFHDALYLAEIGARVTLVHRRATFRASPEQVQRARTACALLTPYRATAYCTEKYPHGVPSEADDPGELTSVRFTNTETGETRLLRANGVFLAVGQKPNTDIPGLTPLLDENGYIAADGKGRTRYTDVYAAGDIRKNALCQIVTACADGAVAGSAE